jgi:hypothetical protein
MYHFSVLLRALSALRLEESRIGERGILTLKKITINTIL